MVIRRRIQIDGPALVFVTTTVTDWVPLFTDESLATLALMQLQETASYFDASVAAYVLMPSHLHVLLGLPSVGGLSQLMQAFKGLSSRKIGEYLLQNVCVNSHRIDGRRVWKPRFDDLIVWSEKQFKIKIEYIHNNPVKAGLVSNPTEYRYSSAQDWLRDLPGLIEVDKSWSWYRDESQ